MALFATTGHPQPVFERETSSSSWAVGIDALEEP
jgi:hypothetical protein